MNLEEIARASLERVAQRGGEIATRLEELDGIEDWSDEQRTEYDALNTEVPLLEERKKDIETRAMILERSRDVANTLIPDGAAPQVRVTNDPFDLRTLSFTAGRADLRARALTAIEKVPELPDRAKQAATTLIERLDGPRGEVSRHLLATGSLPYRTAWQKMVGGADYLLEPEERQAIVAMRALSLTDASGGFAVPFTLDPTIISTKDVSTNPIRRIARNVSTLTHEWNGISSGGMSFSWDGEAAEVSDDSPTLAQPNIPVHKLQGFAVASIEISQDWAGIEADLRQMIQEGKDDAEAVAFTTGTGTNQPTGIVTALDGGSSEISPATAETFAVADVYAVEEALPAKYRLATLDGDTQSSRATYLAARGTYNDIRQFDTDGGADLWQTLGGGLPPRLLGYPALEASAMDSAADIDTGATEDNHILLLGDFRRYVVVDRVGLAVEFIPHLFATGNNRPSGQRGWYCYMRVGADSVDDAAFRILNVATTL